MKKIKKTSAMLLAGVMALSITACSKSNSEKSSSTGDKSSSEQGSKTGQTKNKKIVVWTLAADLEQFAEHYTEKTGNEAEVVVIAPADYSTKLTAALGSKAAEPDVIVGEPQMLPNFFEAGFFADLTAYGADEAAKDKIVDYVYEAGKDSEGVLRALSYQATPGSVIYRRDLAKEIWGNDDPSFVAGKYKDYATMVKTAQEIKAKGYTIFGDTGALRWFANVSAPWVTDGKLQMSDSRFGYFDAAVTLYQEELVAFAPEWSAAWYASMAGELPVNAGWTALEEVEAGAAKTQIVSYVMPSWGALIIRDNAKDNNGKFGVASGAGSFFGGGTFIGVSEFSKNKDAAWDFVQFCTLNEETSQWWLEKSNGDVVSMKSVLEANKDMENAAFGGQKTYEFFLKEAVNIDYSLVTGYDDQIGVAFGAAIEAVQKGEKTKEQAIKDFYTEVHTIFPEIEVPNA